MFLRHLRVLIALSALAGGAFAQSPAESEKEAPFELFGGYSYLHEGGNGFNGWTATLIGNVNRWFGIAADFDGHYRSGTEDGAAISEHENGFTFGPHFALHNRSRVTPFAFTLVGGAHSSVQTDRGGATANGFAMNLGGGLDVRVNERLSARVIQVDAAYTRFNGAGTTAPRISAGMVLHFGKH